MSKVVLHCIGLDVWWLAGLYLIVSIQASLTRKIHDLHVWRKFQMLYSFVSNLVNCITIVQVCITNKLIMIIFIVYIHHELGRASLYWLGCMMIALTVFDSIHTSITYQKDPRSVRMQEVSDVVFLRLQSCCLYNNRAIMHYKPVDHDNIYYLYTSWVG